MSNETEAEFSPLKIDLKLQISFVIEIAISISCLIFIIAKLKLNKYIKSILILMTTVNIMGLTFGLISNLFNSSELECKILLDSTEVLVGTFLVNCLISSLRHDMAQLASKAKIAGKWSTIAKIIFGTLFSYSLVPLTPNIQNYFGYHNILLVCDERQPQDWPKNPMATGFTITCILLGGHS